MINFFTLCIFILSLTAYTQVINLTIYSYLFFNLFGNQYLEPHDPTVSMFSLLGIGFSESGPFASHTPSIYIPFFAILEFIAYLGWVKVADTLLNPWGDDDEDFHVNYLIDRNFQV